MFSKFTPISMALLLSVALNGILIGILLSRAPAAERPNRGGQGAAVSINNDILSRSLPQRQRDDFRRFLNGNPANEIHKAIKDVSALQIELGEHIQDAPEDVEHMAKLLKDIRQKRLHLIEMGDQALVEYINSLSPDVRKTVLTGIASSRKRGGGDGKGGDGMGDGMGGGMGGGQNSQGGGH